jgi:hypothetical protein
MSGVKGQRVHRYESNKGDTNANAATPAREEQSVERRPGATAPVHDLGRSWLYPAPQLHYATPQLQLNKAASAQNKYTAAKYKEN